jgi:hypothetical protein
VLLDAYSPYYALWMVCVCGIPWIRVTGTVADWQKIRDRVDVIAELGLHTWCRSLAAITDQFVRTASGEVDTAFWQRIYNPVDAYGGEVITDGDRFGYTGPGIRTDRVPATLSQVRIDVNDRLDGQNRPVALHAGLVAITQDPDGALRPLPGWHLTPATLQIGEVIDRLIRDHPTTRPPHPHPTRCGRHPANSSPCTTASAPPPCSTAPGSYAPRATTDRSGSGTNSHPSWPSSTPPMVAGSAPSPTTTSLALLLDAALDSQGDITYLETCHLDQLLQPG